MSITPNINFNGTDLSSYIDYINDWQGVEGIPNTREFKTQPLLQSGSRYLKSFLEERLMTFMCTSLNDVNNKMDFIKKTLKYTVNECPLILSDRPDRYINCRLANEMVVNRYATNCMEYQLQFMASDPLWYSNSNYQSNLTNSSQTIINNGNYETRNITLTVPLVYNTTTTITNATSGKSLVLKNTINGADINVTIDFKNGTITGSGNNYIKFFVSGDFFELKPGNNTITCSGLGNGTKTITYKYAWL